MTSKFTELAIDYADPNSLARFWCSVLNYEMQDEDDGIVTIGSSIVPDGKNHLGPVPPTLTFAHMPEGKTVKNRLHLDVNPTDWELRGASPRSARSLAIRATPAIRCGTSSAATRSCSTSTTSPPAMSARCVGTPSSSGSARTTRSTSTSARPTWSQSWTRGLPG